MMLLRESDLRLSRRLRAISRLWRIRDGDRGRTETGMMPRVTPICHYILAFLFGLQVAEEFGFSAEVAVSLLQCTEALATPEVGEKSSALWRRRPCTRKYNRMRDEHLKWAIWRHFFILTSTNCVHCLVAVSVLLRGLSHRGLLVAIWLNSTYRYCCVQPELTTTAHFGFGT